MKIRTEGYAMIQNGASMSLLEATVKARVMTERLKLNLEGVGTDSGARQPCSAI